MTFKDKGFNMQNYLRRIFAMMFAAVGVSALASIVTMQYGLPLIAHNPSLFYVAIFGALGLSIFTQVRAFSMSPATSAVLLFVYASLIGFTMTPLIVFSLNVNPMSIVQAFFIASAMFGCMAVFGYRTAKDLSFMGVFLFIGMIGLLLVGMASMIWPLGSTFQTIVSAIGVLVFALFTAYDMQFLKNAYAQANKDAHTEGQLAVLGALHLYISFIAMFQYVLSLLNNRN